MKVYVDEMPNSCEKCPFCEYFEKDAHGKGKHEVACYFNGSLGNILYGNQTSPKTCPLESIADHDKKVRKEVIEEIRKQAFLQEYRPYGVTGRVIDMVNLLKILDRVLGGEEWKD